MKLPYIISGLLVTSSLFAGTHTGHWGYSGEEGPEHWGNIDPKYAECKLGGSQSPIDINAQNTIKTIGLDAIKFDYKTGATSIVNNGHTVQVNIAAGSTITIDDKTFELKQFHFHAPSENHIDGKSFPLEAHFVHVAKDGSLAVVAVLFKDGVENPIISKVWEKMPHKTGKQNEFKLSAAMINKMLPLDKTYYRFDGSLTTPPCSEGVRWFVMKNNPEVSAGEVNEFAHIMHHPNNRPIQPTYARKVLQ